MSSFDEWWRNYETVYDGLCCEDMEAAYLAGRESMQEEVDRLRETLELMDITPPPHYDEDWHDIAMKLKSIARQALKGE